MTTCAYKDCFVVRHPCSTITFFKLPTDAKRREIWINNAGPSNEKLQNLNEKSNRHFCEKHFEEKYMRRQFNRITLHSTAIPIKYCLKNDRIPKMQNKVQSCEDEFEESMIALGEKQQEQQNVFVLDLEKEVNLFDLEIDNADNQKNKSNSSPVILNKCAPLVSRKRKCSIFNEQAKNLPSKKVLNEVQDDQRLIVPCEKVNKSTNTQHQFNESINVMDKSAQTDPETIIYSDAATQTDSMAVEKNKNDTNPESVVKLDDEDSYFCVKVIAEAMKRLPSAKKADAKLHMISYMFGLENS